MADYDKASEPLNRVVTGEVIVREKGLISKLLSHAGTDADDLTRYLVKEVAVPKLKDLCADLIDKGSKRVIYGVNGVKTTTISNGITIRNYGAISTQNSTSSSSSTYSLTQEHSGYDDNAIVLATRSDAEAVLNSLKARLTELTVVSVSDLYRLVGRNTSFTDRNWGWSNLDRAEIVSVRDGWLLKLPKATSLK